MHNSFSFKNSCLLLSVLFNLFFANQSFANSTSKYFFVDESQNLTYNMGTFYINNFSLYSSHYLPFIGNFQFQYPESLVWGFYSSDVSKKAQLCAERGFKELVTKVSNWPVLETAVRVQGYSNKFLLWVNDYTFSTPSRLNRTAGLWFWASDFSSRKGFWVWEVTLSQAGLCSYPNRIMVDDVVRAEMFN